MGSTVNSHPIASRLKSFGIVQVGGEDAARFLQGQITANTDSIRSGRLSLAAMCNPQGRCISLFFTLKKEGSIWLILKRGTIGATIDNLKKYAVFFKVDIVDVSDKFVLYGMFNIQEELQANLLEDKKVMEIISWPQKSMSFALAPTNPHQALSDLPLISNEQNWLYFLAYHRIPWLNSASQSQFLPHNLDLPMLEAVDFDKGCYTGQEVIARMQYKGKLKSHMQLFECDTAVNAQATDKIVDGEQTVAEVICGATGNNGRTAILALVKDRYLESKSFRLKEQNGPILQLLNNN